MGFLVTEKDFNQILNKLSVSYEIYAPRIFQGEGCFSDTDSIRYGKIKNASEIVFDKKSDYSFKEVMLPVSETIFYFTEKEIKEADAPVKERIIFLRSCDLHAVKRLDEIYLKNGYEDFYYKRLREGTKFILMGCLESFDNCFCRSMGTNQSENYDAYICPTDTAYYLASQCKLFDELLQEAGGEKADKPPTFVEANKRQVRIPGGDAAESISPAAVMEAEIWKEYAERCIACGRCNFACPTCTCFTMQDIFYQDNEKAGERRRVWASCQVDGFTDVAGGHQYREDKGQRMRFKVMHKIYDFKKRFGYPMCVGCGRCDDICPEYISFSNCVNKLEQQYPGEVTADE